MGTSAPDVSDVGTVHLDSAALDLDEWLLAVDGSVSSRMLIGAYGTVDGSGGVSGGWFTCPPALATHEGRMRTDVCELHALRMGLRDFPDGATLKVLVDTTTVRDILVGPAHAARRTALGRLFSVGVEEVLEHRERLTLSANLDRVARRGGGAFSRKGAVADHPLMVAAHRLAYAMKRLGEAGGRLRDGDEEWLLDLIEGPGDQQKKIVRSVDLWLDQRRAGW